jgi:hypothetical protein
MRLAGKTISEHISEIANPLMDYDCTLEALADKIKTEMEDRLSELEDPEATLPFRNLAILMVGGANLTGSNWCAFILIGLQGLATFRKKYAQRRDCSRFQFWHDR